MSATYHPITAPMYRPVRTIEIEAPAVCEGCGVTLAPDGACLEIGSCELADARATRTAARETAKYTVAPAAWNARGYVD